MNNNQLKKDRIYLNMASTLAMLSKDANTQVGAKIIAADGSPVSEGRNGISRHIPDGTVPLSRDLMELTVNGEVFSANKYPFMIHAEENALLFTTDRRLLIGATIYVTHMPCPSCASKISQSGIARVVCPVGAIAAMTDHTQINIARYIFEISGIMFNEIEMNS